MAAVLVAAAEIPTTMLYIPAIVMTGVNYLVIIILGLLYQFKWKPSYENVDDIFE